MMMGTRTRSLLFKFVVVFAILAATNWTTVVDAVESRKGDAIQALALSSTYNGIGDDEDTQLVPGIYNCLNSDELQLTKGTTLAFQGGVRAGPITQDATLYLKAHQGIVQQANLEPNGIVPPNQDFVKVAVRWTHCSFESDESLAMQMLFAVGSIASMIVFIAILFDSRLRRDKYS